MINNTIIIAEAGVNHNGDINKAKELVFAAKESGADFVKFQTFNTNELVTTSLKKAEYQIKNEESKNQYEMLKKLELNYDDHNELYHICKKTNIGFLSSAFDIESLRFLNSLEIEFIKIPSGEITNYPYLKFISTLNKKIILSTGMANLNEIGEALDVLTSNKISLDKIYVLHCTTSYPTDLKEVNLNSMIRIKNEFKVKVGYSDHTEGIEVSLAAVTMGAKIIEKHFTLDKNLDGPDHLASLDPKEFSYLTKCIRNIELAFGNNLKIPTKSELQNKQLARKYIVAKKEIIKGEVFSDKNITTIRAGKGLSAIEWPRTIGKKATRNYILNEPI